MRIRIRGCEYADANTRIRIRGYGYADTDTRIRGYGGTFEVRLSCVWKRNQTSPRHRPQDINRVRALSLQGRYENIHLYMYIYVKRYPYI